MTVEEAERVFQECAEELGRRRLLAFTQFIDPTYAPSWHHVRVAQEIDDVIAGKTKRLMLFMPPQHGKTTQASRNLVPLALGQNPDLQIIFATYNAERAKEVSADVQDIMASDAYRKLFPGTRLASSKDEEVRTAQKFDVVGRRGMYQAAGVGQGIAGKSMMLGILDDPFKNREEAESETVRKNVWNWYVADFTTRQMGADARIILIQTRWHTDDLAGRLLKLAAENPTVKELQWKVVSFPAICDEVRPDDPRQLGEALWPARFPRAMLDAERVLKGVYDWESLYQQRPVPPGGAMAKREWFRIGQVPVGRIVLRCRCWDLAATVPTPGRDPDWTVGTKLAKTADGAWVVEHVIRVRDTPGSVDRLMLQTALSDGRACLVREWQDPGAAGKSVIASHLQMLAGFDYEALPSSGDKSQRWRPFLVQAEGGNVTLAPGAWTQAWLDEMALVPYGLHDDQADSVTGAFIALTAHKSLGPTAVVILPGAQTVSGPSIGSWREQYFRR